MASTLEAKPVSPLIELWREGAWPCFSPNGARVVFTGHLGEAKNALMILDLERDGAPRVITPPDLNAKRPTWLAGGREIVFNDHDAGSIQVLDTETGTIAPFLSAPDLPRCYHPCAYPDRRAVAVVAFHETDGGRAGVLYRMAPGAEVPFRPLTRFPEVCAGRPGVAPDGETVVFAGNAGRFDQGRNQIWLVGRDMTAHRLEPGDPTRAQGRAPRVSPDGRWIAFTSTRPAPNPTESTPKAVWIVSRDGREAYRLSAHEDPGQVAWSSDQRRLVCGGIGCPLSLLELPERFHAKVPR